MCRCYAESKEEKDSLVMKVFIIDSEVSKEQGLRSFLEGYIARACVFGG